MAIEEVVRIGDPQVSNDSPLETFRGSSFQISESHMEDRHLVVISGELARAYPDTNRNYTATVTTE